MEDVPDATPLPTRPRRALLLEGIHPDAETILLAAGYDVATEKRAFDVAELAERLHGVEVLGIRSGTQVPEKVLDAAPDLLTVGAFCIGTNQIDLAAAAERGVAVFNAPFSNTRSVVELALAEIIALTRRLTEKDTAMHAGLWDKSARGSHEVRGRTLGIVGYGNIGTQLSVVAEALGMSVVFYDTADRLALGNARRCASLDELLETADVVTLHVDGRPSNADLFGEDQFAKMRSGSLFLNLSRGFVVDHHALRRHIESGHIAGAAVDVFPSEPAARGEAFESPLRGLPNVILTPHIGGSTEEAQQDIGTFVASKLLDYVETGSPGCRSTCRRWPCRGRPARAVCCTCTATSPASSPGSTACSPSTTSTSRPSCSAPGPARVLADRHPGRLRAGRRPRSSRSCRRRCACACSPRAGHGAGVGGVASSSSAAASAAGASPATHTADCGCATWMPSASNRSLIRRRSSRATVHCCSGWVFTTSRRTTLSAVTDSMPHISGSSSTSGPNFSSSRRLFATSRSRLSARATSSP